MEGASGMTLQDSQILGPGSLFALTGSSGTKQNSESAGALAPGATANGPAETQAAAPSHSSQPEMKEKHE